MAQNEKNAENNKPVAEQTSNKVKFEIYGEEMSPSLNKPATRSSLKFTAKK
jgi:hypothetical protein